MRPRIFALLAIAGLAGSVVWVGHCAGRWLVPAALYAYFFGALICVRVGVFPVLAFGPLVVFVGAIEGIVRGRMLYGWPGAILGFLVGVGIGHLVLLPFAMLYPLFFTTDPIEGEPADPAP